MLSKVMKICFKDVLKKHFKKHFINGFFNVYKTSEKQSTLRVSRIT